MLKVYRRKYEWKDIQSMLGENILADKFSKDSFPSELSKGNLFGIESKVLERST